MQKLHLSRNLLRSDHYLSKSLARHTGRKKHHHLAHSIALAVTITSLSSFSHALETTQTDNMMLQKQGITASISLEPPQLVRYIKDKQVFFSWNRVKNSYIYEVQDSEQSSFTTHSSDWPMGLESYRIPGYTLKPQHYYRVRAWSATPEDGGTCSPWSQILYNPFQNPLVAPAITSDGVSFFWQTLPGFQTYEMEYSSDPHFEDHVHSFYWSCEALAEGFSTQEEYCFQAQNSPTFAMIDKMHYRVRGINKSDLASPWSRTVHCLQVAPHLTLVHTAQDQQQLHWNRITEARYYQLRIQEAPQLYSGHATSFWPSNTHHTWPKQGLDVSANQYWCWVRAWSDLPENHGRPGPWSQVLELSTLKAPQLLIPKLQDGQCSYLLHWKTPQAESETESQAKYQYELCIAQSPDFANAKHRMFTETQALIQITCHDQAHYLRVRSCKTGHLTSPWSTPLKVDVENHTPNNSPALHTEFVSAVKDALHGLQSAVSPFNNGVRVKTKSV